MTNTAEDEFPDQGRAVPRFSKETWVPAEHDMFGKVLLIGSCVSWVAANGEVVKATIRHIEQDGWLRASLMDGAGNVRIKATEVQSCDDPKPPLPHSGIKETPIPGGALREVKEEKGRYDLLPTRAMRALAIHFERGGKIYGYNNWQKGLPFSSFISSAKRHIDQFKDGDTSEDHLAAAAWNILCMLELKLRDRNDCDDRTPFPSGPETNNAVG